MHGKMPEHGAESGAPSWITETKKDCIRRKEEWQSSDPVAPFPGRHKDTLSGPMEHVVSPVRTWSPRCIPWFPSIVGHFLGGPHRSRPKGIAGRIWGTWYWRSHGDREGGQQLAPGFGQTKFLLSASHEQGFQPVALPVYIAKLVTPSGQGTWCTVLPDLGPQTRIHVGFAACSATPHGQGNTSVALSNVGYSSQPRPTTVFPRK